MSKYIDAMRIDFDDVDISGCTDVDDIIAAAEDLIDAQPAEPDVVKVIRCKDCKHFIMDEIVCPCSGTCGFVEMVRYSEDFCSFGERRCADEQ